MRGVRGVDSDLMTRVCAVRRRNLKTGFARWTGDQQRLPRVQSMKALKDVDSAQRYLLPGAALATGVGHTTKQAANKTHSPFLRRHRSVCRDGLNGSACKPEVLLDARMWTENDVEQQHGRGARRTPERFASLCELALLPRLQGDG